jgi:uncharacterized protein (DUF1684 family)
MGDLEAFRAEKDAFFRDDPHSPLTPEQRGEFEGLTYFPENDELRIDAELGSEGVDRDEPILMQTTSGDVQEYRRAGVIRFAVDGRPAVLTLYASDDAPDLFIPFRDATSGNESYGAGRYLEVNPPAADGHLVVDLNLAYNPFCAYNPDWACPIPPIENWLRVPIRAGERTFPGAHEVPLHSRRLHLHRHRQPQGGESARR